MECVRAFAQEVGSAATDYDCVPLFSNSTGDVLHHGNHAIGIESLIAQGRGALITASPENFGHAVETTVHAFVTAPNGCGMNVRDAGNLFGEQVVPEFPPQVAG